MADLILGTTPPHEPADSGAGLPLFRPGDLGGSQPLRTARQSVSESAARHGRLLPAGSVLVSCIGILGKVGILGCAGLTNQQLTALVPKPGILPEYLYYWAQTLRPWLGENASATTLPIVNKQRLGAAPFPLVPLAAQQRIVADLQAAQARHDRAAQALAELPAELGLLQRSLLTEALAAAPHAVRPLGEVVELQVGYAFRSSWFTTDGVRLLRGINVAPGAVSWAQTAYVPASRAEPYAAYALQPGDVVVGLDRPLIAAGLRAARIQPTDLPALLVQRVARLTPRGGDCAIERDYLLLCLRGEAVRHHLTSRVTGTQLPHLRPADLATAPLPVPPLAVQRRIVKETTAAWQRVADTAAKAQEASAQLAALWQQILHRAFFRPDLANGTLAPAPAGS